MNDNSKPNKADSTPQRFRPYIVEVTKPNGQIYYEAQQRFWLFGTRWRNALQDGWGLVSCAHTFSTAKDAHKALKIHLTPTTYKVVD